MTDVRLTEREEQPTAVVRGTIPTGELPEFFARAFRETMAAIQAQGLHPTGPPFGLYRGMPTDTVDVEAGFPVSGPITPTGEVRHGSLPGGRVVTATHLGPYDTLSQTYDEVYRWAANQSLALGAVMWESYLSDPETPPDPATWRTEICCRVA